VVTTPPAITELLAGTARGDAQALQQLYAVLYPEIKRVARIRLAQSGPNGRMAGLNTTALVHEGFLRMADQQGLQGDTRGQFFAACCAPSSSTTCAPRAVTSAAAMPSWSRCPPPTTSPRCKARP
jgi:hypothetical protein